MKTFWLYFLILIVSITFIGCEDGFKDDLLKNTQMIKIFIYKKGNSNKKYAVAKIKSTQGISEIVDYISKESTPHYKCAYNGSIVFYMNNKEVLEFDFNLTSKCRHIVFVYKNKLYFRRLTEKGVATLKKYQKK